VSFDELSSASYACLVSLDNFSPKFSWLILFLDFGILLGHQGLKDIVWQDSSTVADSKGHFLPFFYGKVPESVFFPLACFVLIKRFCNL